MTHATDLHDTLEGITPRELTPEEIDAGYLPASRVGEFNPDRYDFRWTPDYGAFVPRKLLWWDDASYLAHQAHDSAVEFEADLSAVAECEAAPCGRCPAVRALCVDADTIPF